MVPGKLSIIIPFCNEHPQVAFTIQNLKAELVSGGIAHEIIAIDNWCDEVAAQGAQQDGGSAYLERLEAETHQFRYIQFKQKLSHWNAKNTGVKASNGEFLFFIDAHCLVAPHSLVKMYRYYAQHHHELNGTLHMPICYMLDPNHKLIYAPKFELDHGIVHYTFAGLGHRVEEHFRTPCMSTCGMMMSRAIYDSLGGWPKELGIYGGGENFINYTLAIIGKHVNIYPAAQLFHYAAPRGYSWNYLDFHRNRCIASFMYGGPDFAKLYMRHVRGSQMVLQNICETIINNKACKAHRDAIEKQQNISIGDWVKSMT